MQRSSWPRKALWRGAFLGLLCAAAAWLLGRTGVARGLEEWALDGCFAYRGTRARPAGARVVLVGLDEVSLDRLGKPLAYSSPELAEVVRYLKRRGAAAIGIDALLPEGMQGWPDLRAERLGEAIQAAGNVVLAEWHLGDRWLRPAAQWQLKHLVEPRVTGLGSTDFGFINLTADPDHFLRRQQLVAREGEQVHLPFALSLYSTARGLPLEWRGGLRVGGREVPLDGQHRLVINYVGPEGTFQVTPFHTLLAAARGGPAPPVDLEGAIAILSVTAGTQQDYHATPYANNFLRRLFRPDPGLMSGAEVHANILATLADGAYIRVAPAALMLPVLLLSGAVLGMLYARLGLLPGLGLAVAHHFGWKALCFALFVTAGWYVPMVPMLLLGGLAYAVAFAFRWRWQRRMMGVVKSEPIARLLEADPDRLLRGEEREITVLFSDVRGFTTYSEAHPPREVVALLNTYFSAMVPIVEEHGGLVNQYLGDGLLAIFGAPDAQEDHAARAVRAAVAMVQRVHELQPTWAAAGSPELRIGVGIHTGPVISGMVGAPRRLDYTVIGDTVNAASRIEGENKRLGTEILISARTWEALPPAERARLGSPLPPVPVQVKGKQETLDLYPLPVPE